MSGIKVADAANRAVYLRDHVLRFWLDPLQERAALNRLMWERLRGIAFNGWESVVFSMREGQYD